jgi:hypothetical protein
MNAKSSRGRKLGDDLIISGEALLDDDDNNRGGYVQCYATRTQA